MAYAKCKMIMEPARDGGVPRWLRKVLLRGLAPESTERWPSIERLLQLLQQDPRRGVRRAAVASVLVLATGGGAVGAYLNDRKPEPCGGAVERVESTITSGLQDRLRASFLATGRPYARDLATRFLGQVGAYADAWTNLRTQTCRATRIHQEQSELVMERKMTCLDESLDQVRVYLEALAAATSDNAMQGAATEEELRMVLELVHGSPRPRELLAPFFAVISHFLDGKDPSDVLDRDHEPTEEAVAAAADYVRRRKFRAIAPSNDLSDELLWPKLLDVCRPLDGFPRRRTKQDSDPHSLRRK